MKQKTFITYKEYQRLERQKVYNKITELYIDETIHKKQDRGCKICIIM